MVGFGGTEDKTHNLDGNAVPDINEDLTSGLNIAAALPLPENLDIQHEGDKKGGDFEVTYDEARRLLSAPNLSESSSLEVLRPWFNGKELNSRREGLWIIDFAPGISLQQAAMFPEVLKVVEERVKQKYGTTRQQWWVHERPRPAMRQVLATIPRFILTTRHSKHRLFDWATPPTLPDSAMIVFARSDDYFFGVLHSSIHELWALRMGTQLEDRPRYTPTTCFETFPLPWPPGKEPGLLSPSPQGVGELVAAIAAAARELNEQRERWLNPPEWIDPIAKSVDAQDDFADVPDVSWHGHPGHEDSRAGCPCHDSPRALIRQSAIMARAAQNPQLKKRTLTNLYNERATWLRLAHKKLDQAVLAAYAAADPAGGWSPDWADVWEETGAGQPLPAGHALMARRTEIDQGVLANLLRMNQARC
jgi:hypothetical protein